MASVSAARAHVLSRRRLRVSATTRRRDDGPDARHGGGPRRCPLDDDRAAACRRDRYWRDRLAPRDHLRCDGGPYLGLGRRCVRAASRAAPHPPLRRQRFSGRMSASRRRRPRERPRLQGRVHARGPLALRGDELLRRHADARGTRVLAVRGVLCSASRRPLLLRHVPDRRRRCGRIRRPGPGEGRAHVVGADARTAHGFAGRGARSAQVQPRAELPRRGRERSSDDVQHVRRLGDDEDDPDVDVPIAALRICRERGRVRADARAGVPRLERSGRGYAGPGARTRVRSRGGLRRRVALRDARRRGQEPEGARNLRTLSPDGRPARKRGHDESAETLGKPGCPRIEAVRARGAPREVRHQRSRLRPREGPAR